MTSGGLKNGAMGRRRRRKKQGYKNPRMRQLIAVADFDSVKLVFQYFEAS